MSDKLFRERIINESTGVRLVAQYVREFWECGWQEYDQRNDKGIDGEIILRKKGIDLGAKINVQIKCGKGYISSIDKQEIRLSVDDPMKLIKHLSYWRKQNEPAVLIFINPYKMSFSQDGMKWKDNRLQPQAWWVNLKDNDIQPEGTITLIRIPKSNTFGEHSKGAFLNLARKILENNNLQVIDAKQDAMRLYNSINIRHKAREYFLQWKNNGETFCAALKTKIIVSKIVWRHILLKRRGDNRRVLSLRLLGIAKQIIEEASDYFILAQKENEFEIIQHIGLRCLVKSKNMSDITVQVVLLKKIKKQQSECKVWFYSVHHRS
jgi:hypothetical protein